MIYRERLTVPVVWWLLALAFALTSGGAVGFYLGPAWGVGVGLAALLAVGAVLVSAATLVVLTTDELRVGRAVLELAYVGGCRPLTAPQTAARTGPVADARAHLVLRPYLDTAVEVTLDDPADPVPYWLVSTRHPGRLAAAIEQALATRLGR